MSIARFDLTNNWVLIGTGNLDIQLSSTVQNDCRLYFGSSTPAVDTNLFCTISTDEIYNYRGSDSVYARAYGSGASIVVTTIDIARPRHIFMTAAGNGTGANNFNGDYSVTPLDIYYEAVGDFLLYSMKFCLSDSGQFAQSEYGGGQSITNGVKFFFKPAGLLEVPLFNALAIKTNFEYANMAMDYHVIAWAGTPQTSIAEILAVQSYGCPLSFKAGDRFIIRLNDNFTGLLNHTFLICGKEII